MFRNLAFVVGYAVILVLSTTASVWAADFGTAEELCSREQWRQ
jgi:hypothetical protein